MRMVQRRCRLAIGLLLAIVCGISYADVVVIVQPTGSVCAVYYTPTVTPDATENSIGASPTRDFVGFVYVPDSNQDVCRVDVYVAAVAGNRSSNDYYCRIFTVNVSNELSASVGTSDKVDGENISSGGYHSFIFSTPVSLTSGVEYAITWFLDTDANQSDDPEVDDTNDWAPRFDNEAGSDSVMIERGAWAWVSGFPHTDTYIDADDLEDIKVFTQ